jgi:protein subunit release factor A
VITFDPVGLARRRDELEQAMGAPGFWDDQAGAARISTEHSRLTRRLERYERLRRDYEDAKEFNALDGDLGDEIAEVLAPLERELGRLQEDALVTGK